MNDDLPRSSWSSTSTTKTTTDAAEIARADWDLDSVEDSFRSHIATLSAALAVEDTPPATAGTLRRLAQLLNAPHVDLIRDPGLPVEIRPANWPGPELAHLVDQVRRRYLPPAAQHVHAVIAFAREKEAGPAAGQHV